MTCNDNDYGKNDSKNINSMIKITMIEMTIDLEYLWSITMAMTEIAHRDLTGSTMYSNYNETVQNPMSTMVTGGNWIRCYVDEQCKGYI